MYIRVHAHPGERREKVEKIKDNEYRISVREEAERGEANDRIKIILAKELGVEMKSLRLKTGRNSPSKLFELI